MTPMDGERMASTVVEALTAEPVLRERDSAGRTIVRRPRTILWFAIVGLALAGVLCGLYWFNGFRQQAMATYFAHNKPPPAQISAVVAQTQPLPRFAPGSGSITAVRQVTVTPEIGGRVVKIFFEPGATVKAGDPLVQLNHAPAPGD